MSETVALSILPNFTHSDVDMEVLSSGSNTVRITLSGADAKFPVIRVPLLVRSNSGFKVSANFDSNAAVAQLTVTDVRATGALVSPNVINALDIMRQIDLDASRPLLVLSGPRVSLGGTLDSPNNALQVTLLIRMRPQAGRASSVQLTFTGTAVSPIQ